MIGAIEYFFFSVLSWTAQQLPFKVVGKCGRWLGGMVFVCTTFRKAVTLENLRLAFPTLTEREIRKIALGAFRNYGTAMLEMLWAENKEPAALMPKVRIANLEVFEHAFSLGRGLILLSAHYGNWEFLVSALRLHSGQPFSMIVQLQQNTKIDARITQMRSRFGNSTIPMGPSVREVITTLKEGRVVLMLGDQSGSRESVFVDFFGRPAATRRGPAAFCLKTGSPVIMVFLVRQPDGSYVATFEDVDMTGLEQDNEENVVELTRRHTAILEEHVRLHPEHWLWMHKRWKHTAYHEAIAPVEGLTE